MKRFFLSLKRFYLLSFLGLINLVRRPFYARDMVAHMAEAGPGALSIVLVTTFVEGMALAMQVLYQFVGLGLETEAGKLIGLSIVNELCPITMGILFSGRVGLGITAELAGMVQRQQIDTLQAFGVNPIKKLVTPRIASSILMMPALTFLGNFAAIIGGFVITCYMYNSDPALYWSSIRGIINVQSAVYTTVKPVCFAYLIACISCYVGMTSSGGTSGLKQSIIRSFWLSTIAVMITDFMITKIVKSTLP